MAFFGLFGFFLVSCAYGEFWSFWLPCCIQDLGYLGVPPAGHALGAEVGGSITFVNLWGEYLKTQKTADKYLGFCKYFYHVEAVYASVSGTAQSP